jgi:hypothetical protein
MLADEKSVEDFAKLLHYYQVALAPDFGCGAAQDLKWHDLSTNERKRLVAATRLALLELQSADPSSNGNEINIFSSYGVNGTEGRDCGS